MKGDGDRKPASSPEKGGVSMKHDYNKFNFWLGVARWICDILSAIIDFIFG